jgi:arginyl-tRNA synthetase
LVLKKELKKIISLGPNLLKDFPKNSLIQRAEVAGPGFLNFWLEDGALKYELEGLLSGEKADQKKTGSPKILIEFVSANPTGPLHVGHGRGAALGDSLVRIFRRLGYTVSSEFYVNDSGGQIRNLGFSVEARVKELNGEKVEFPEGGYKGSYIIDIAKEAVASGKKFKSVTQTQLLFDENDLAGFASSRNLKTIQSILANFDVSFDQWYRESNLHAKDAIQKTIKALREKNLVYEQEGAVWFKATEFGDEKDRVLQKGNEAPTYFAADIAYHDEKFSRGYDKLVNIWGADHHGYAQRVKGAMKALGHNPEKLDVVFNQLVSIKGGRMSKRAGDMVTLQEVIDEVGKDATRFFFALRSPGAHFEFDLDLAKKQASENPVYYVQYVHARCRSIFREAEKRGYKTDVLAWKNQPLPEPIHEAEKAVLLHLGNFEHILEMCAADYSSHHLTVYLVELAGKYHSFYEKCMVLVDNDAQRSYRLGLVEAIRRRVAEGLNLLGVNAPDSL